MKSYWETWQLFFMCYITISSTFCYPFFLSFRKTLIHFTRVLTLFFFFRKILIPFTSLFLKSFFVFLTVPGSHFYICEKIFDWSFILKFYVVCSYSSEFSSIVFLPSETSLSDSSEEIFYFIYFIFLIIFCEIFVSLTTYLHSSFTYMYLYNCILVHYQIIFLCCYWFPYIFLAFFLSKKTYISAKCTHIWKH